MKHKGRIIPKEEIMANRSSAYEFLDFDNMKDSFIKFIGNRHPDPDTLLKENFDQMISLAVEWCESKFYTEEYMIEASQYGYNFHKTTFFPEQDFEDSCIRNTQQWMTKFKKK